MPGRLKSCHQRDVDFKDCVDIAAAIDCRHEARLLVYGDSVLASKDRTKINKMAAQIGVSFTALMIRLKTFQMLD